MISRSGSRFCSAYRVKALPNEPVPPVTRMESPSSVAISTGVFRVVSEILFEACPAQGRSLLTVAIVPARLHADGSDPDWKGPVVEVVLDLERSQFREVKDACSCNR